MATRTLEDGRRVVEDASGGTIDVVVANASDIAASGMPSLAEGVYVVGTGGTGAVETFLTLGGVYSATILAAAFAYRVPRAGWAPEGWSPPAPKAEEQTACISSTAMANGVPHENGI